MNELHLPTTIHHTVLTVTVLASSLSTAVHSVELLDGVSLFILHRVFAFLAMQFVLAAPLVSCLLLSSALLFPKVGGTMDYVQVNPSPPAIPADVWYAQLEEERDRFARETDFEELDNPETYTGDRLMEMVSEAKRQRSAEEDKVESKREAAAEQLEDQGDQLDSVEHSAVAAHKAAFKKAAAEIMEASRRSESTEVLDPPAVPEENTQDDSPPESSELLNPAEVSEEPIHDEKGPESSEVLNPAAVPEEPVQGDTETEPFEVPNPAAAPENTPSEAQSIIFAIQESQLTPKAKERCKSGGEVCSENPSCCSGFCSWTRGFTCFSING